MPVIGDAKKFEQSIDSMIQSLCLGSLSLHVSRVDTQWVHLHSSLYGSDRTYFKTTKKRAFIREAKTGEFDYSPSSGVTMEQYPALALQKIEMPREMLRSMWREIPRLWVLVSEICSGTHHVSTIYRGDAFFKVVDREGVDTAEFASDAEFADALAKIQVGEGLDADAWQRFLQKYWDAAALDAAKIPENCGVIH